MPSECIFPSNKKFGATNSVMPASRFCGRVSMIIHVLKVTRKLNVIETLNGNLFWLRIFFHFILNSIFSTFKKCQSEAEYPITGTVIFVHNKLCNTQKLQKYFQYYGTSKTTTHNLLSKLSYMITFCENIRKICSEAVKIYPSKTFSWNYAFLLESYLA